MGLYMKLATLLMIIVASVFATGHAQETEQKTFTECWAAVTDIAGCWQEVYTFLLTGRNYPGPSCCKAILNVGVDCWANIWIPGGVNPALLSQLNSFCSLGLPSPGVPLPKVN
ncbi:hypothetical protein AMTRI_Chr07g24830 [Amborella trichopoda]|uniref:Prolamin-like domain-containing protein n=1 Tax=Amborella trichopoda TaxID=13333 RepID=U5D8T1_AMBTC|nr:egg cell-secreted protein 1.4 [Amborella trichopoda]ERN18889.1 hypothetical protein AMTR_s00067p00156690 [Amborella trichopoda]|eukprot:XP_006857422.1 egg cell-secreted protein 1.4 [Amborella trichopoda]